MGPDHALTKRLKRLDSPFRTQEAEAQGVPRWRLRKLVQEQVLIELGRGLYQRSDTPPSAELDFVALAKLAPRATVCLGSALAYWDLSDEIPRQVHIAVPRHSHRPQISYPPTKVHEFGADTYDLERRRVETRGGGFFIYGPERSVVDAFRLQRTVGRDQAFAAIRRYMDHAERDPRKLLRLAGQLRARRQVAESLEVLLS